VPEEGVAKSPQDPGFAERESSSSPEIHVSTKRTRKFRVDSSSNDDKHDRENSKESCRDRVESGDAVCKICIYIFQFICKTLTKL
jgi:hypothetical protein